MFETSPDAEYDLASAYARVSNLQMPTTHDEAQLAADGWLRLERGDVIVIRDMSRNPAREQRLDEVMVSFYGQDSLFAKAGSGSDELLQELRNVREDLLGPTDELDGRKVRGTAFERSGVQGNKQGERCINTSISRELPKRLGHPCGNVRVEGHVTQQAVDLCERLNKVCGCMFSSEYS